MADKYKFDMQLGDSFIPDVEEGSDLHKDLEARGYQQAIYKGGVIPRDENRTLIDDEPYVAQEAAPPAAEEPGRKSYANVAMENLPLSYTTGGGGGAQVQRNLVDSNEAGLREAFAKADGPAVPPGRLGESTTLPMDQSAAQQAMLLQGLSPEDYASRSSSGSRTRGAPVDPELIDATRAYSEGKGSSLEGIAAAEQERNTQQAKIMAKQADELAQSSMREQQRRQEVEDEIYQRQEERDIAISELEEMKIDPNRMYNQGGWLTRGLAAVGAALGGFAEGYSRGAVKNVIPQIIDSAIQRDIDAQKAAMQNKRGIVGMHDNSLAQLSKRLGSVSQGEQAYRQGLMQEYAMKFERASLLSKNPEIAARLMGAKEDLSLKLQQMRSAEKERAFGTQTTQWAKKTPSKAQLLMKAAGKQTKKDMPNKTKDHVEKRIEFHQQIKDAFNFFKKNKPNVIKGALGGWSDVQTKTFERKMIGLRSQWLNANYPGNKSRFEIKISEDLMPTKISAWESYDSAVAAFKMLKDQNVKGLGDALQTRINMGENVPNPLRQQYNKLSGRGKPQAD